MISRKMESESKAYNKKYQARLSLIQTPDKQLNPPAMDLLDNLEISPVKSRTFKKNIDIRVEEVQESGSDNEAYEDDQSEAPPAISAIDISKSSILNSSTQEKSQPPSISGLFGSANSLFDKVKRRLNGEQEPESKPESQDLEPTQEITSKQSQTQKIQVENENGPLFAEAQETNLSAEKEESQFEASTQIIPEFRSKSPEKTQNLSPSFGQEFAEDSTQKVFSQSNKDTSNGGDINEDATQKLAALNETVGDDEPQNDVSNFFSNTENHEDKYQETQEGDKATQDEDEDENEIKLTSKRSNKLFLGSDSEDEHNEKEKSSQLNSTQSRLQKIEALAAKKRAERLLREQQERDKEQKDLGDFKKLNEAVYGDEDEDEAGDVSVSTIDPNKRSRAEKEELALQEQRERISEQLEHEEKVVKTFDKNSLLAAFGMGNNTMTSPTKEQSSPVTSPIGSPTNVKKDAIVKTESGDIELSDSSDSSGEEATSPKPKPQSKEAPKFTLRTPFNMNKTTPAINSDVIELGSDSDSDIEIAPSKVTRLEVKSKFSKQTINRHKAQKKKALTKSQLFLQLKEKARSQLKLQNQHNEESHKAAIEEVATEQEAVDKLLDKYIEAANRTRDKELENERRRKLAEEAGEEFDDDDYTDNSDFEGEVPDSDVEDDEDDVQSSEGEVGERIEAGIEGDDEDEDEAQGGDDEESAPVFHKKHRKQALMSDDDDEEEEVNKTESIGDTSELKSKLEQDQSEVGIDLGSFGGNFSQNFNGMNGEGATQRMKNMLGITMSQAFERESPKPQQASKTVNIFDQLRQNGNKVLGEESFIESTLKDKSFSYSINSQKQEINFDEPITQLSEIDPPTQGFSTQKDSISTLQDSSPLDFTEATAKDDTQKDEEEEESVKLGKRRLFKKPAKKLKNMSEDEDEDEEDEEETEEQIAERRRQVEHMREQLRKRDLEIKRKRAEMKRKGLDKIMENEAEESEDEWHGLGGFDGERSDEENSEDEKMLDDYSKVKLNKSQIAKYYANEDLQNDEKMLHKILNDVNNGGFRKRGVRNGVELEFSDEEDAYLQQYNRIRNQRMRDKMLENGNIAKLAKDAKAQAFFETITEDSQNAANEIFGGDATDNDDNELDNEDKENDPFNDKPEITKEQFQDPSTAPKKRKFKITEAYVQKTLSFLNDGEEDEIERNATIAAHQHGFLDDDDDFGDDLSTLKQKSIVKLPERTPQKKSTVDLTNESDQSPEHFFKMPSKIMKSFQSKSNDSFKNSNEVTVSTAYKAATSSKASIMSFGKNNSSNKAPTKVTVPTASQDTRVLKARKIEKTLRKGNRLKGLNVGNFE